MQFIIGIALSSQMFLPPVNTSAFASTKTMYDFWCTAERAENMLCEQRSLSLQLMSTTDEAVKKVIKEKLSALYKKGHQLAQSSQAPSGNRSLIAVEFAKMKMAYCATNPPNSKTLCSTAASRCHQPRVEFTDRRSTSIPP